MGSIEEEYLVKNFEEPSKGEKENLESFTGEKRISEGQWSTLLHAPERVSGLSTSK